MRAKFKPVVWVLKMADYQFVSFMDHKVGFLHIEDVGVPAHQYGGAAIQLIPVYIEWLIRGGPAFKDNRFV